MHVGVRPAPKHACLAPTPHDRKPRWVVALHWLLTVSRVTMWRTGRYRGASTNARGMVAGRGALMRRRPRGGVCRGVLAWGGGGGNRGKVMQQEWGGLGTRLVAGAAQPGLTWCRPRPTRGAPA